MNMRMDNFGGRRRDRRRDLSAPQGGAGIPACQPSTPGRWRAGLPAAAALAALLACAAGCGFQNRRPDIVLVVIDTLRPDRMSAYGAARDTTPFIRSIAERGVRFDAVYAPAPWTVPSMASLLTGLQPRDHGCRHGIVTKDSFGLVDQEELDAGFDTLAERLRQRGYRTFGLSANPHIAAEMGFAQGFDVFETLWMADADAVNAMAGQWRDRLRKGRAPFFLMLHYFDPHSPYYAKEPWAARYGGASTNHLRFSGMDPAERNEVLTGVKRELGDDTGALDAYIAGMRADLLNLYDSEIAFTDDRIRQLFGTLAIDPEKTVIVVTADHGEEFFEHGGVIGHGRTLYEVAVRIPLIWSLPGGRRGARVGTPVSLLDVLPTLLELAGAKPASGVEGLSLVPALRGEREPAQRSFILETERHPDSVWVGLVDEQWKYMLRTLAPGRTGSLLVNLAEDPGETRDCKAEHTEIAGQMHQSLEAWSGAREARQAQRRSTWLDPKREQELRSLGYLK